MDFGWDRRGSSDNWILGGEETEVLGLSKAWAKEVVGLLRRMSREKVEEEDDGLEGEKPGSLVSIGTDVGETDSIVTIR